MLLKRPIWESSWLDIQFHELEINLKCFSRPSAKFYSNFYYAVFGKYDSFDALPSSWKKLKSDTALEVSKLITGEVTVLSYGSGFGYIEKEILKLRPKLKINTYDFSDAANDWLRNVSGVTPILSIDTELKYQFIYCIQLQYALSNTEIADLSRTIKNLLTEGGVFLTVDTSLNPGENFNKDNADAIRDNIVSTVMRENPIKLKIKNLLRPLYYFLFRRDCFQFWGWQRDNSEVIKIFSQNGFVVEKKFAAVGQSFLLFKLVDS
jgi:hypothetical protein